MMNEDRGKQFLRHDGGIYCTFFYSASRSSRLAIYKCGIFNSDGEMEIA